MLPPESKPDAEPEKTPEDEATPEDGATPKDEAQALWNARGTGTPGPNFWPLSDEELEDLLDLWGYRTP